MYSVIEESKRILSEQLVNDDRLKLPEAVKKAAEKVTFTNEKDEPFIPTPLKMTESSSALWALLGSFASAIAEDRYGKSQSVEVDTDLASLYLMSAVLVTLNGKTAADPYVGKRIVVYDKNKLFEPYRRVSTNIYQAKDGVYFHLHGSMNADPTLTMLELPLHQEKLTDEEAIEIYKKEVAKHDSKWLDTTSNEVYRQPGTICYTPEEFLATEQGKAIKDDPIYNLEKVHNSLPAVKWPSQSETGRPLDGIRVLDISRVIAAPAISKLLAALGATVLRISSKNLPDMGPLLIDTNVGKLDAYLDLKSEEGKAQFIKLIEGADVVLDGYRPGALEKLGFSQEKIQGIAEKRGKGIVYIRENCYGWKGPLAHRSGWQQISDCVTGTSWLQGKFFGLNEPVVPLLPNSDYQVGLIGTAAVCHALYLRALEGGSYNVDVSLNQFNLFYISLGLLPDDVQEQLKQKHSGLKLRHYDDMVRLVSGSVKSIAQARPGLLQKRENYSVGDAQWGIEGEKVAYLKPAVSLSETPLGYKLGSSMPGTHSPEWP